MKVNTYLQEMHVYMISLYGFKNVSVLTCLYWIIHNIWNYRNMQMLYIYVCVCVCVLYIYIYIFIYIYIYINFIFIFNNFYHRFCQRMLSSGCFSTRYEKKFRDVRIIYYIKEPFKRNLVYHLSLEEKSKTWEKLKWSKTINVII